MSAVYYEAVEHKDVDTWAIQIRAFDITLLVGEISYNFPEDEGKIKEELQKVDNSIRLKFIIKTDADTDANLTLIKSLLNLVPPMCEAIFIISGDGLCGALFEETVGLLKRRDVQTVGIKNYRPKQSFALKQRLSNVSLLYLENVSNECLTADSYAGLNCLIIYNCVGLSYLNFSQQLTNTAGISRFYYYTAIKEEFEKMRFFLRNGQLVKNLRLQYKNDENEIKYEGSSDAARTYAMALTATNMHKMILEQLTVDDLTDEKYTPEERVFDGSRNVSGSEMESPPDRNIDSDDDDDDDEGDAFNLGHNFLGVPMDSLNVSNDGNVPKSVANSIYEGISDDGQQAHEPRIILRNNFLSLNTIEFTAFSDADQCDNLVAFLKKLKRSLKQITINMTGGDAARNMNILWTKIAPPLGKSVEVNIHTHDKTIYTGDEILIKEQKCIIQSTSGMYYRPPSSLESIELHLGNATDALARQYASGLLALKWVDTVKIYGENRKVFYYIYKELENEGSGLSEDDANWSFIVNLSVEYDDLNSIDLSVLSRNRPFLYEAIFLKEDRLNSKELAKFGGIVAACMYLENALSCEFANDIQI